MRTDYKRVIEDYASGKIKRNDWLLVFDNDCGYWTYTGSSLSGQEAEDAAEAMGKEYGTPGGYGDLVSLAESAGIRADWC